MNEPTYNRRKCDECDRHPVIEKEISDFIEWIKEHSLYSEKVQQRIGDRVKTSQFRWVSGGLAALLVVILGFVVTLYAQNGNMRVDLTEKISAMTTEQRVAIATEKATLDSMQSQVNHIASIQVTVTRFIGDQVNIRRDIDRLMDSVEHLESTTQNPSINVYPERRGGTRNGSTQ